MKSGGIILLAVLVITAQAFSADRTELKTDREKISYTIGVDMGNHFRNNEIDVDPDIVMKGFRDSFSGKTPLLSEEEMRAAMTGFQQQMMAREMEKVKLLGEKNKTEGEAFLAENRKKEGVVTLASGLQYKILTEGKGKTPKESDTVTAHYKGTLVDGTVFDSSYERGRPESFPVSGVIAGWTEALQLMKTGSRWQLFIPSQLAYGERGGGQVIGPHSVLIFDVELLSIQDEKK